MEKRLPFTVAIDAEKLLAQEPTGVEIYVQELLSAMTHLERPLPTIELVLPKSAAAPKHLPAEFGLKFAASAKRYGELWWPLAARAARPDLCFEPSRSLPSFLRLPRPILTVHDLAFLHYPDHYESSERRRMAWRMRCSVERAEHILAVSEATKLDIIETYSVTPEKISVTPLGVDLQSFRPDARISPAAADKIKKFGQFFLFVGRLEARKNVLGLLEAYRLLLHEQGEVPNLVLLGRPGFGYDQIELAIAAFGRDRRRIIQPGYASEEVKQATLHAARALVFPSLYEGSSLPVLEAQASALPVITSNRGATKEVAGRGALLVDPEKPLEIAGAMSRLMHTPEVADDIVRRGLKNVQAYTWERTAELTIDAFELVYRRG